MEPTDMFPPPIPRAKILLANFSIFFFVLLLLCLATSSMSVAASDESAGASASGAPGAQPNGMSRFVGTSNFGFQCGIGDTHECEGPNGVTIVWPNTQA